MPREYADILEDDWQRACDLADEAEDAGMTPEELIERREQDRADSIRDRQNDRDDRNEY